MELKFYQKIIKKKEKLRFMFTRYVNIFVNNIILLRIFSNNIAKFSLCMCAMPTPLFYCEMCKRDMKTYILYFIYINFLFTWEVDTLIFIHQRICLKERKKEGKIIKAHIVAPANIVFFFFVVYCTPFFQSSSTMFTQSTI